MLRPENIPDFNRLSPEAQKETREKLEGVTLDDKLESLENIQKKIEELKRHRIKINLIPKFSDSARWSADRLEEEKFSIQKDILDDLIKKPKKDITVNDRIVILDLAGSIYEYFTKRDLKIFTDESLRQQNVSPETTEWKNKLDQYRRDYGFEEEENKQNESVAA